MDSDQNFGEMFGGVDLDNDAQAFDKIDGDQVQDNVKAEEIVGFNLEKTKETNGA